MARRSSCDFARATATSHDYGSPAATAAASSCMPPSTCATTPTEPSRAAPFSASAPVASPTESALAPPPPPRTGGSSTSLFNACQFSRCSSGPSSGRPSYESSVSVRRVAAFERVEGRKAATHADVNAVPVRLAVEEHALLASALPSQGNRTVNLLASGRMPITPRMAPAQRNLAKLCETPKKEDVPWASASAIASPSRSECSRRPFASTRS